MGKNQRDYVTSEETDDYIPGTDVLGVEKDELPKPTVISDPQEEKPVVRDATPNSAIDDDPVTDRSGRAPNPPVRVFA
jgi:hypothetical protein